jgi:acyl dehydratase
LEAIEEDDSMTYRSEVWPNGIPQIGQKAQRSRGVTARDIQLFTEISGDRNPLHYDEEAARATRFGGIVVQGGVTSAILNAVVAEDLPGPGTVFLQVNWDFKAPVRPGDSHSCLSVADPSQADHGARDTRVSFRRHRRAGWPRCLLYDANQE